MYSSWDYITYYFLQVTAMKLTPYGNRFLVKPDEDNGKTNSGIIIAGGEKEKPMTGIVDRLGNGELVSDSGIKVGNKVIFRKYDPDEIEINGGNYLLVDLESILAKVE